MITGLRAATGRHAQVVPLAGFLTGRRQFQSLCNTKAPSKNETINKLDVVRVKSSCSKKDPDTEKMFVKDVSDKRAKCWQQKNKQPSESVAQGP